MKQYRVLAIRKPGIDSPLWRLEKQKTILFIFKFWEHVDSAYDYGKDRIFGQFNALSAGGKEIVSVEIDTRNHTKGVQLCICNKLNPKD